MKKKDFLTDYCASILLKLAGPLIRCVPLAVGFFIGRVLGDLFFVFDLKHRAIAYANIKTAVAGAGDPRQIRAITRQFFRAFGQNLIEIFYIPLFDKRYVDKYVTIEGSEHVAAAFEKGKGVIFVAVHAGGWELGNILCANQGLKFSMFVGRQNFPRVEKILNSYRSAKGCTFIQRENELRQLISVLKANESVAMTIDQGGRGGLGVTFFNKNASMASGAVRLALKLDCSLIPVFPIRIKGPRIKFFVEPAVTLINTGSLEQDIASNVGALVRIFERYIARYPHEYLWTYKVWKYSTQRELLIVSDGKTGHLRQSQALANIVCRYLKEKNVTTHMRTVEVKFKNTFSLAALTISNCLSGKYICQGCLFCLKAFLDAASFAALRAIKPDIIISCGSSLVPVNYQLSRENQAKSMVIMRPSVYSTRRFDLVVAPSHDNPPRRTNVAVIDGALNLIDAQYLATQTEALKKEFHLAPGKDDRFIGLLIGGDTKNFSLSPDILRTVLAELKDFCESTGALLLTTTSRRTSRANEQLTKQALQSLRRNALLIIANEKNYPFAVGGILGLSSIAVLSCESISMISEALSSGKYVVVFDAPGVSVRHRRFLKHLADNGSIFLVEPARIKETITHIMAVRPPLTVLDNAAVVERALRRIL